MRSAGRRQLHWVQIFSGAAGGPTGLFTMLVSDIVGAEREKVEIVRDGKKRGLYIGRKIQGEIEMLAGKDPEHPVMVSNSKYWMGPDIIAARDKLRQQGARVLGDGEPKQGAHGRPVLFLHPKDFSGTLIELEQV